MTPLRVGAHDLAQARAVVAWAAYHRRPVQLYGCSVEAAGAAFWRAVEDRLGLPVVIVCGDRAGTVLAALRAGSRLLGHDVEGAQTAALDGLIEAHGARRERLPPDLVLTAMAPVPAQLARWWASDRDRRRGAC